MAGPDEKKTVTVRPIDTLVIGAGIAGLAAARKLAEAGQRVLVLEARNRVGGRIFTETLSAEAMVEHGAEFIHGKPPALWEEIRRAGLRTVERDGTMLQEAPQGGGMRSEPEEQESHFGGLAHLTDLPEDVSFADWIETSGMDADERQRLTGYVEGFNAADAARISARALGVQQRADDAIEGDRGWHLSEGYSRLPEFVAEEFRLAGGELLLSVEVFAIRWRRGQVVVSTVRHGDFRAPRCIITLPLGVLQAANAGAPGSVRIEPEPRALFEARRLAMGHVLRFTIVFRERWWERAGNPDREDLRSMSFAFTPERKPPVWWTRRPEAERLPTLTGWSGGPGCTDLLALNAQALGDLACRELAGAFRLEEAVVRAAFVSVHVHNWTADRFSMGSYSYVPVDALDAPEALSQPVADTLFFAGEHTDTTGHWGTVHAALGSGLRAATQILGG